VAHVDDETSVHPAVDENFEFLADERNEPVSVVIREADCAGGYGRAS
jgi:hypothetical protein